MSGVQDLEAAVRASWDRESLAVYGDHLMSIGDPRGELVAMDLRIDQEGAAPAVVARREELIAAWFGSRLPPGTVRYGFVDLDATGADAAEQAAVALQGPGGAYVRSAAIAGPPDLVARALALLASAPRPWLTRLVVRQWRESGAPTIAAGACAQLVATTPHLASLEVNGRRVFGELVHPGVRALRVSGFDALASLTGEGTALAVTALDFAFHCHYAQQHAAPSASVLGGLLPARRLPALVELDLSRNEPGRLEPHTLGGDLNVCAFVDNLALRARLETLRLPPPISSTDVVVLQHALLDMPALRELIVVGPAKELRHPTAAIRFVDR